jgi:hypothetical protein
MINMSEAAVDEKTIGESVAMIKEEILQAGTRIKIFAMVNSGKDVNGHNRVGLSQIELGDLKLDEELEVISKKNLTIIWEIDLDYFLVS